MSLPTTDRTKLNNLSPNLVPQQIAVSALRLAVFQEIYTYLDNIITDLNAAQATGAVTTPKLADGGVSTVKLADNAVTSAKLLDAAVIAAKLADGSVTTQKVGDGAVVTIKLADGAVVSAKIADLNVTSGKIADNAVISVKLADGAVLSAKIADGAVTSLKIADGGVTSAKIADNTITTQKLVDSIITAAKILDGSVTNAKLAPGSVTGDKVANGAINSQHMDAALLASAASLSTQAEFDKRGVNVQKFGAKGDGIADDTAAIQAAINYAQINKLSVYFPNGTYIVNSSITLSSSPITISGSDFNSSIIKAGNVMKSVFLFLDDSQNSGFTFNTLCIDGNALANYGIYSTKIAHLLVYRVKVLGTLISGIAAGYGYCNDFVELMIQNNIGDGIQLIGADTANNIVNIVNCKIFFNNGIAISAQSGNSINITGCTIERNKITGIYARHSCYGLLIRGCYFEANAETGFVFDTPALTYRADVIINGSADATKTISYAFPANGVIIDGCTHQGSFVTCLYLLLGCNNANIRNNTITYSLATPDLIGLYGNSVYSKPRSIHVENNAGYANLFSTPAGLAEYRPQAYSSFLVVENEPYNYFPQSYTAWSAVIGAGSGAILKGDLTYEGYETIIITSASAGTSHTYGVFINLANYPELVGQLVYCGAWVKSPVTAGVAVYASGVGYSSNSLSANANWNYIEFQMVMPPSGTVSFGFTRTGGNANDNIYIAKPHIGIVGTNKERLFNSNIQVKHRGTAAPTTGTWAVGDIFYNKTPTLLKNILYWTCINATGSGTWTAFGSGQGTTAQRPALTAGDAGYAYFDTTLAKMITWSGTGWLV